MQEQIGPYEFSTEAGVRVYLHDADFLGLVWQPDATLRLYFPYDPDWTPPEAKATPVVQLTFSQVQMLHWETDMEALSQSEPVLGRVSDFSWDGSDRFDLATFTLSLSFSAGRMAVRLVHSAPRELAHGEPPTR